MKNWIIKSPKFKVKINGKYYTINEYTLRNLMLKHSKGELSVEVRIKDNLKYKYVELDKDGKSPSKLVGFSLADDLTIDLWNYNKRKRNGTITQTTKPKHLTE